MAGKRTKGKSTSKANANRVKKAVKKVNRKGSVAENAEAIGGVVSATAESARRSSNKKQRNFYTFLTVVLIIAIIVFVAYGYFNGWFDSLLQPESNNNNTNNGGTTINDDQNNSGNQNNNGNIISNEQMSIHFLELGNKYTGDCIYIKAGDTDILIDAGSRQSSAAKITEYVNNYCTDGKLEFVVATHADQDHIAGFVGTSKYKGVFESYECETIIQFANTNKNTQVYKDFCTKRDAEVANGAKLFTALDCVKEQNGAQKVYNLTKDGSITMEVLYQRFYEDTSSDENNYSVCLLFTQGENHYLFTGDLEGAGEASLVASNPDLPHCVLYKAGHHGSKTSSSKELLAEITPEYVCVCCCAGSTEYTTTNENTFPTQIMIDNVAPYTDKVYVTTLCIDYKEGTYTSMNGDIVFSCSNGQIVLSFSNNDLKLKDTEWFKNNRTCPDAWK